MPRTWDRSRFAPWLLRELVQVNEEPTKSPLPPNARVKLRTLRAGAMRTVEAVRAFVSFNAMLDGTRTRDRSVRVGCSVIKVASERGNAVEPHHPRSDQWSANPRARDDDAALSMGCRPNENGGHTDDE